MALSPIGQKIKMQTSTGSLSKPTPSLSSYFPATNMAHKASVRPTLPPPVSLSPFGKIVADKTKGVTISQGKPDPSLLQNSPLAKIPMLGKLLTGTGEKGNANLYARDTFAGTLERQGLWGTLTQGFKNYTNPDRSRIAEQVMADRDRMIARGSTPEKALTGAFQNLHNTKIPINMTGAKLASDDIKNPGVELTENQQKAVRLSNIGRKVLAVVDSPVFGGTTKAVKPAFQNFTDLSTKILGNLEGRTTVSKQFIFDLTNSGELKQPERDLFRKILEEEGDIVDVPTFANKVKSELLPLDRTKTGGLDEMQDVRGSTGVARYESISLPSELRGPVSNYSEHIYGSPIKTTAGGVHFSGSKNADNYFAHSRIEDMADGKTRRVIEAQSDLFQKGRLEGESFLPTDPIKKLSKSEQDEWQQLIKADTKDLKGENPRMTQLRDKAFAAQEAAEKARKSEVSKLEPYRNTWQDRIVREEVKKASKDGKTKLQFPTGETAMKIEGLSSHNLWKTVNEYGDLAGTLTPEKLQVGKQVAMEGTNGDWIITDLLGGGKFKAVPKSEIPRSFKYMQNGKTRFETNGGQIYLKEGKYTQQDWLRDNKDSRSSEAFDISGKVDQNNPIYKFYEKEMGKYLKNKYSAERVIDDRGVSWYEVTVKKEYGNAPVEAFKRGINSTKNVTVANLKADMKRILGVDLPIFGKENLPEGVEGQMVKGIIEILEKGGKVSDFVGKHETWHLIKRGMVTVEERKVIQAMEDDLIKKFSKKAEELRKAGYSEEELAEELMANEFARYYQKGTTFSEKLKVIFDKIIQRIELLVKNKTQVLTYFKNVSGKLTGKIKGTGGKVKYSMNGEGKQISEIDRLIAQGKVRVRMIGSKDTYEVKKGDTWKVVRDEDSAIKQATPVLKPKTELPEKIQERQYQLEVRKEMLGADPAAELSKYVSKRGNSKGLLAEVTGKQKSKTGLGVDVRTADAGFDTSEDARKAYEAYKTRKVQIKEEELKLKADIKLAKQEQTISSKPPIIPRVAKEQVKSLEELANKQLEALPLLPRDKPLSLESIVTQTPVNKKVGFHDFFRTPDRVLNKIGFGKEAQLVRDQYEKYVIELPKNIEKITNWSKQVPKGSSAKIFKSLDGENVILTKEEQRVANEIKAYLAEWADRLKLPADKRIANYITHLFDDQLLKKEFDEDLAKLIADKIPGQVYDPFLEKRLGAKGYKQDVWTALDAYTKRATRKVHMDPALERIREKAGSSLEFTNLEKSQFEYIQKYVDKVNMRPSDIDSALDTMLKQTFIGYRLGQRPLVRMLKFLRQRTYVGMLGGNLSSALRNLSQGVNTYATLGEKYTTIGYAKLFNAASRKELKDQGVFANNFIEDRTVSVTLKAMQKVDKALFVFFDTAEKINRGAAYLGAKSQAVAKGMDEAQAIQYAKKIVRKTQFNYDPIDASAVLSSDLAKTIGQFMSYPVKQTEFLAELLRDKNFAGLLRYGMGGMAFVYTVGQAFGMEPKEILPSFRFGVPPSLKLPAELAKAGLDSPDKYGNDRDWKQKAKDIGKSGLGLIPGGIQAKKSIEGYQATKDGAVLNKAGREQFDLGDTPLAKAQAIAFGKYSSQEAKDYFNKVKTPEQELQAKKALAAKEARTKVQPVYDQVQALKAEGKTDEAQKIVEGMSEKDYEVYVKIRTAERGEHTETLRLKLELDPVDAVQYLRSLSEDEQKRIINLLSDEEYALYETGK